MSLTVRTLQVKRFCPSETYQLGFKKGIYLSLKTGLYKKGLFLTTETVVFKGVKIQEYLKVRERRSHI